MDKYIFMMILSSNKRILFKKIHQKIKTLFLLRYVKGIFFYILNINMANKKFNSQF